MKVKHFHIRLNKENLHQDEEAINSFMQTVSVKKPQHNILYLHKQTIGQFLFFI